MGFSRRGVLAALATGVGVAVVPAPPGQPQLARVQSADGHPIDGIDAEGPIRDERDTPVARYHYKRTVDGFEATAPINMVFDLERATGGLERVLEPLEDSGWVRNLEEYTRYAYDADRDVYVRQQATAAETYYGTSGRRHVRCWQFGAVVSMQAHVDTGAQPKHGIESYADARQYLSRLYAGEGWDVSPQALDLENAQEPDHDGYATVIHEVEP